MGGGRHTIVVPRVLQDFFTVRFYGNTVENLGEGQTTDVFDRSQSSILPPASTSKATTLEGHASRISSWILMERQRKTSTQDAG